jgi:hypothetical protein
MPTVEEEAEVLSSACVSALHSAASIANGNEGEHVENRLAAIQLILAYASSMPGLDDEELTDPALDTYQEQINGDSNGD